ncbi:MAG: hypothetical protein R3F34_18470 [Planctomycetota bacterium]
MARLLSILLLLLGALGAAAPLVAQDGGAAARTGPVVVRIEGQLSAASQSLLRRAIQEARPQGRVVVLDLDTPGGEVTLMWSMARAIDAARTDDGLRFVAYVDDMALSAGSLLAMSCDEIHMAPKGRIGAATPITYGMEGVEKAEEKFLSAFRAEWRAWAERNGRSPVLAEGMVDERVEVRLIEQDGVRRIVDGTEWDDLRERGAEVKLVRTIADSQTLVALTADEALEFAFSDGTSDSLQDLVEYTLGRDMASVTPIEPTAAEELVSLLAPIAPFLLVFGILLALVELQAPGFGIAGIGSILCFALMLASRWLAGLAGWEHVVALVLGGALILVEAFVVPGTFVAGVLGALLVIYGLVASQLGPGFTFEYSMDRKLVVEAALSTLSWTLAGLVVGMLASRWLPRTPLGRLVVTGPREEGTFATAVSELARVDPGAVRPGALGTAATALRPVGRVRLDAQPGTEFEASVDGGAVDAGERVRVVATRTGRLVVEVVADEGGRA